IDYQDEYNIRVINMSMGGKPSSNQLPDPNDYDPNDINTYSAGVLYKIDEAFNKGIVTVTSAGNNGAAVVNYPGDFATCVNVMNLQNTAVTVEPPQDSGNGNLNDVLFTDAWSLSRFSTSNYNAPGERAKDISAPGSDIISLADRSMIRINGKYVPYRLNTGTSMAAPQVSGVLALMFGMVDVTKDAEGAQRMVDALYTSARSISNPPVAFDDETGYGVVDALEALNAIDSDHLVGPSYVHTGAKGIAFTVESDMGVQSGWQFSTSTPDVLSIDEATGACEVKRAGFAEIQASNDIKCLIKNVVVVGDIEGYDVVTPNAVTKYAVQTPTTLSWEWSSSNSEVASVSNAGVLSAGGAAGKVTITATLVATKGSQHELTVSKDVLVVGPIAGPSAIWCGKTTSLAIQGPESWTFSPEDFVWATADSKIATVDKYGVVNGVCGGETTIWAYPKDACSTSVGEDGLEHLSSELSLSFSVCVRDVIDRDAIKVSDLGTQTYTGKALTPSPKLSVGDKVLQEGVDYTLSYSNNVNAGTATVTISGAGAFAGSSRKQTFKIARASIADAKVASISSKAYTGKAIEPKPKVAWNGTTLKLGRDYALSYKNNKKGSTAKVIVTGVGNFAGTKTVTFGIVVPTVAYRSYVHNVGWKTWSKNGASTGTSAKGKYVEGLKVKLTNKPYSGGIKYRVHVQNAGWQAWKANGAAAGVVGKSKRAEAVRIVLTGSMKSHYSVSYRVKIQGSGWTKWAKDGKTAGTTGKSLRITAVQIKLVPKA
ncbi:MAG: S8 family serine peptidase, partial [Coriobacteriales bacterium]|nr:S8 family serine peptidase [Coriobacteriales bacterium]